ncbi:MAG: hypothetical protein PHT88_05625 [Candidatus Moranbacteria bacterium]|nr:hypothetical protein [Candidatus Moranbacteria bacterium]
MENIIGMMIILYIIGALLYFINIFILFRRGSTMGTMSLVFSIAGVFIPPVGVLMGLLHLMF